MAMPGLFSPVEVGDRVLVDGGLLNNVPWTWYAGTGLADRVIAVDVGADLAIPATSDTAVAVLRESIDAMIRSGVRRGLSAADLVLVPRLRGVQTVEFGRERELRWAEDTRQPPHALTICSRWPSARETTRPGPRRGRRGGRSGAVVPTRLTVEHVTPAEAARITHVLARRHLDRPLDASRLDKDLLALAGDGRYESATYRIERAGQHGTGHRRRAPAERSAVPHCGAGHREHAHVERGGRDPRAAAGLRRPGYRL